LSQASNSVISFSLAIRFTDDVVIPRNRAANAPVYPNFRSAGHPVSLISVFPLTYTFPYLLSCIISLCTNVPISLTNSKPVPSGKAEQERSSQQTFRIENLCSLLTKGGVGALLKRKMEDPKFFVNESTYKAVQPSPLKEFSISISTDDGSGFNYNKESGKKQGRRIREVQGIGKGAYFDDGHFHVLKGNHWLTFGTAASSGHHPPEEVIKALAKKRLTESSGGHALSRESRDVSVSPLFHSPP
jgi:hypothetical protein